jgi:hypothetical protein
VEVNPYNLSLVIAANKADGLFKESNYNKLAEEWELILSSFKNVRAREPSHDDMLRRIFEDCDLLESHQSMSERYEFVFPDEISEADCEIIEIKAVKRDQEPLEEMDSQMALIEELSKALSMSMSKCHLEDAIIGVADPKEARRLRGADKQTEEKVLLFATPMLRTTEADGTKKTLMKAKVFIESSMPTDHGVPTDSS